MVCGVVHRIERSQLAKETHHSYMGDRGSGSSGALPAGSPRLPPEWERRSFPMAQSSAVGRKAGPDRAGSLAAQGCETVWVLGSEKSFYLGSSAWRAAQKQLKGGCSGLLQKQTAKSSAPGLTVGFPYL